MMLAFIARDLAGWPMTSQENGLWLQLGAQVQVEISLQSKRLFMATIMSSRFSCSGRLSNAQFCEINIHQPGWIRRQPIEFRARKPTGKYVAAHLNRFVNLRQTLSELDYRRFTLTLENQSWRCIIEPWAASEVVCRMPPLRRYLRLEQQQRILLLSSLKMMYEALTLLEQK